MKRKPATIKVVLDRHGLALVFVLALLACVFVLLGLNMCGCLGPACGTISAKVLLLGRKATPVGANTAYVKESAGSWQPYASTTAAASARAVLQKHFPQSTRCTAGSSNWQVEYASLHSNVVAGKAPPKYLTNVGIRKGVADRVTGWVTLFYLALLSNRAITTTFKAPLPGFEAACDMPYINWTHPFTYPDGVLDLADLYHQGMSEISAERYYPNQGPVNSTMYHMLYLANQEMKPHTKSSFLQDQNLTGYPPGNEQVPYVIANSNRGQTYKLTLNPYHKQQFWSYGLTPETAYMCGFFYLCSPNREVQDLYRPYWDKLSQPGLLKIAIMVRVGDHVFKGSTQSNSESAMAYVNGTGDLYFRCAAALEKAFALPGQKVVWYLISDSLAFRQAAKTKFGDKVLTDLGTKVVHPDCKTHNPEACNDNAMRRSMQHSFGQLFTYSLADYHIHTSFSGFGRLGAWASGKNNNLFELIPDQPEECDPYKPTPHQESAGTWSLV